MENLFNWHLQAINADSIRKHTKGEGVKVAVIDTGIDTDHPDLSHAIKKTIDFRERKGNVEDEYGHGTHVAGLIAGLKTGVAPNAELYVARVLNIDGYGSMTNVIDGITFAINHEVDILCISLGIPDDLPMIVKQRIKKAYKQGIIIVSASGNNGWKNIQYPARYDEVVCVGGVDKELNRADFSSYGNELDVVAPAVDVVSTFKDGNYSIMSGTSMASPIVAGGIALLKSYYKKKGIELTNELLREKFKKLGDRKTDEYGYGLFDLSKLMD